MNITFTVPGAAVGKGRPRATVRGKFVSMYTPEKTASYENLVKIKAQEAMAGQPPSDKPCCVDIRIRVMPPESWSIKKKAACIDGLIYPTSKPDMDNVIKGIFDAMNGIVFNDDKQVVRLESMKTYGLIPCVIVEVWEAPK